MKIYRILLCLILCSKLTGTKHLHPKVCKRIRDRCGSRIWKPTNIHVGSSAAGLRSYNKKTLEDKMDLKTSKGVRNSIANRHYTSTEDITYFWSSNTWYKWEGAQQYCFVRAGRLVMEGIRNEISWNEFVNNTYQKGHQWIGIAENVVGSDNFTFMDGEVFNGTFYSGFPAECGSGRKCAARIKFKEDIFKTFCKRVRTALCEKVY